MQTHEWEVLLEGTTPGPWEATDERDDMGIIGPDGFTLIDVNEYWSRCTRADLALAAQAPTSVAEVVRLRQAMTRLRDTYAAPDDPGDDYGRGMEAAYQIAATALTRILEGEEV